MDEARYFSRHSTVWKAWATSSLFIGDNKVVLLAVGVALWVR